MSGAVTNQTKTTVDRRLQSLAVYVELERRIRQAENEQTLGFLLVNEIHGLSTYRQAVLWQSGNTGNGALIAVSGLAHRLKAEGRSVIHMEFGQPSTGAPADAIAAAHRVLDTDPMGYWESPALKARIVRHYAEWYGVTISPAQVLLTCGASPALVLALVEGAGGHEQAQRGAVFGRNRILDVGQPTSGSLVPCVHQVESAAAFNCHRPEIELEAATFGDVLCRRQMLLASARLVARHKQRVG